MTRYSGLAGLALGLCLAGCDAGGGGADQAEKAVVNVAAADTPKVEAKTRACMFRETEDWKGSSEGGRLLVTGKVDVQMAGMKPQLTERTRAAPGVVAFDLALVPEPGAAVSDRARFERRAGSRYSAGEIYCGGERIARFDMINL